MRAPLKIQSSPKGKVNAAKSWIKVGLSKLSLMLYPQGAGRGSKDAEASTTTLYPLGSGRDSKDAEALKDSDPLRAKARVESYASTTTHPERSDFALVSFVQDYQSSNLNDRTPKRQFWSRENGHWKIIHETSL